MKINLNMPLWITALAALLPLAARAQNAAPGEPADGAQTRAWIDLQISNSASVAGPRPMPGEVADEVYSRYVKSFSHPIPDQFERSRFVENGGSGGSSSNGQ